MTWRLCWVKTRTIRGIQGSCEEVVDYRPVDDSGMPSRVRTWIAVERAGLDAADLRRKLSGSGR